MKKEDPKFFLEMNPFPYKNDFFLELIKIAPIIILSAPSRTNREICVLHKRAWIDMHLFHTTPAIFESKKEKYAGSGKVLIDDKVSNVSAWIEAGGLGYVFDDHKKCLQWINKL